MKFVNAALVLLSLVAGVIACEIILWLVEPLDDGKLITKRETATNTYSVLIPNAVGKRAGHNVTVNEAGYRGKFYSREREPATNRIMIFGDSHTLGIGASDRDTYPAVVERILRQKVSTQVLNLGVGGHDLRQIIGYIRDAVPLYKPDLVVLTFHAGDLVSSDIILQGNEREAKGETASVGALYETKQFLIKNSYLMRFVIPYVSVLWPNYIGRAPGITDYEYEEISQEGQAWRSARRQILEIRNYLCSQDVKLVFVMFPSMNDFKNHPAKELHRLFGVWLQDNEIEHIDLLPYYDGKTARRLWATLLDKHPNVDGYQIAGEAVAEWLRFILIKEPKSKYCCRNYDQC